MIGSYDDDPPGPGLLSQYKTLQQHFVHQTSSECAFAFWSGCGAVRKELFLRLGGVSESYPRPAVEDIEFGHRLRADGRRILLDRGSWFAARAIPLHFLYYYYSGIAFLIGALRYGRKRWFRAPRRGAKASHASENKSVPVNSR